MAFAFNMLTYRPSELDSRFRRPWFRHNISQYAVFHRSGRCRPTTNPLYKTGGIEPVAPAHCRPQQWMCTSRRVSHIIRVWVNRSSTTKCPTIRCRWWPCSRADRRSGRFWLLSRGRPWFASVARASVRFRRVWRTKMPHKNGRSASITTL